MEKAQTLKIFGEKSISGVCLNLVILLTHFKTSMPLYNEITSLSQAVVAYTFNCNTGIAERSQSLSSRPAWPMEQVEGLAGLHRKINSVSKTNNQEIFF